MTNEIEINGVIVEVDEDAAAPQDDHIARVRRMEAALDEIIAANEDIAQVANRYAKAQEQVAELARYLGSEAFFSDLEADEAGLLPTDLKRGVLSQDGAFNALADNYDSAIMLLEAATKALKSN